MELNLKGKRALVTGGSKGIGKAIVDSLRTEGVEVKSWSRTDGVDLDPPRLQKLNIPWQFEEVREFDILCNNFGGGGTWREEDWDRVMRKNYGVTKELTLEFLKKERAWGRVVTITSIFGKEKGMNPGFVAAKAAQIAFMKSLAGKYPGTTFNCIAPGHIDVGKPFPDSPKIIGKPEDVAGIVTFLCSDLAKHINGAVITVDGGASHSF